MRMGVGRKLNNELKVSTFSVKVPQNVGVKFQ